MRIFSSGAIENFFLTGEAQGEGALGNIKEQRKVILIKQGYVANWGEGPGHRHTVSWKGDGDSSVRQKGQKVVCDE